jgi:hypothetical protein
MNIVVTGYYYEKNLGDELFLQIAQKIFIEDRFKKQNLDIQNIQFVKIDLINTSEIKQKCDKIILFGGETLNDYFIDKLIEFKLIHHCNIYGIGVSCNQNYEDLDNKINIFDYLVFRNKKDYEYFNIKFNNYCEYVPDIVFMIKNNLPFFNFKSNRVGIFPATPMYISLGQDERIEYLNSIKQIIDYWLKLNYKIYFFAMSNSTKQKEDDSYIIKKIINLYPRKTYDNFVLCDSNSDVLTQIKNMKYNICWRFHSVVLSIINNVPFITFSSTPKVETLLKDNLIEDLGYSLSDINVGLDYLRNNKKSIIKKLNSIYNKNNEIARKFYKNLSYLNIIRKNPPFYLTNKDYKTLIDTYIHQYKILASTDDEDYNCNVILYLLNRSIDSEYHYGLKQKIFKGIDNLSSDLRWLINDLINKNSLLFYYTANAILNKIEIKAKKNFNKINMNFINQFDMRGLHRSGWTYVLDNLSSLEDVNGIYCDFYVDRTFHWNNTTMSKLKVIPYKNPWIGFIHHTTNQEYSEFNTVALFKNPLFLQSLKYCKGLILLTEHLKNEIKKLFYILNIPAIPLFVLTHPTEFVDKSKLFSFTAFKSNNHRKMIQIGAWMRDINGIFQVRLKNDLVKKAVLIGKKMEGYYTNLNYLLTEETSNDCNLISRDNKIRRVTFENVDENNKIVEYNHNHNHINHKVEIITFLENHQYDELFISNIVFLKLIDASAINTLIECIVRTTPIVINKIKPVVEVLGEDYPLLYSDISEIRDLITMKNIENAHQYLKKMNKTKFRIEYFISSFQKVLEHLK